MTENRGKSSEVMIVNAIQGEMRRVMAREFMTGCHNSSLDGKRAGAWQNYGYKEDLEFADFYRLWRRNGIANALITRLIGKSWHDEDRKSVV